MPERPARADRLIDVTLDETGLAPPTPEIEQERRVAIFDLLEENRFALPGRDGRPAPPGPYRLHLAIRDRRLVFELEAQTLKCLVGTELLGTLGGTLGNDGYHLAVPVVRVAHPALCRASRSATASSIASTASRSAASNTRPR